FRGPLATREGALGAVLASGKPVLLQGDGPALSHYEGPAPAHCFCGVPLRDRQERVLGALVADRDGPFNPADEQVLTALAAEVVRAMEGERLLGAVRREKEEKARFFRALEELNRTTTVAQAADCAVAQAREMGALDLCAVTLGDEPARAGPGGTPVCATKRRDGLPDAAQAELGMLALQAAAAVTRTRLYEQAERLATTDGLTGLMNRRSLNAQLAARVREAQRYRRPL